MIILVELSERCVEKHYSYLCIVSFNICFEQNALFLNYINLLNILKYAAYEQGFDYDFVENLQKSKYV